MSNAWYHFLGNNSFQQEASEAEASVRAKYPKLLEETERILLAFRNRGGLGRDKSYFTSKRILIKDGKGVGGKRKNYLSIPYWSIQAFAIDTAGKWDGDVNLKVYSTGKNATVSFAAGHVDIFSIQQFLNSRVNWKNEQGSQDYVSGVPPPFADRTGALGGMMDWFGDNAKVVDPKSMEDTLKTVYPVLLDQETVHLCFKSGRDYTVFTDTRYLMVDVQGIFGKKVEFASFPWRAFSGFSVQTAGAFFDRDTEMTLYTNILGRSTLCQDFRKQNVDIFAIQTYLSNKILGEDASTIASVDRKQGHVDAKSSWWFRENQRPLDADEVNRYYHATVPLLQNSETVEMAFKGRRDVTIFTTKRLIEIDPKGLKGVKVEYTSVPWSSVLGFGVKTAGKYADSDCEALLYTDIAPELDSEGEVVPGLSFVEVDFNKDRVDLMAIKKYLSARCLTTAPDIPVPKSTFMVSAKESRVDAFFSEISSDHQAIDPVEINIALHTTIPILMDDENTIMAFKAGRDMTLFTNMRVLIVDVKGWSGKKVEYKSIPYGSIRAFSAESAGAWDLDAEVDLYTRNNWDLGKVELDFRKGKADIVAIQKFLSGIVLGDLKEAGEYLDSREPLIPETNPAGMESFKSFLTGNAKEIDAGAVNTQLHSSPSILLEKETVTRAFRKARDMYVYTDLRILVVDVQGLKGRKIEYKSIPWSWCHVTEFETAGNFDNDAEIYLHTDIPRASVIKQSLLVKDFDIYAMHQEVYAKVDP